MNSNNTTRLQNENDLKFVPLNLKEPFSSKTSNWLPIINNNISTYQNFEKNINNDFIQQNFGLSINSNFVTLPPISILPSDSEGKLLNSSTLALELNDLPIYRFNDENNNLADVEKTSKNQDSNKLHCYASENSKDSDYDVNFSNGTLRSKYDSIEPLHMEILRSFSFSFDDVELNRNSCNNDVDILFEKISRNNPSIITALKSYKIPSPIVTLIVKQIINLSLKYSKNRGDIHDNI